MRKAFASDFDGTIHFWGSDELVGRDDREAIAALRATGGLFGVSTGRPLRGLTRQTDGIIDFDFYIAMSGAAVFDGNLTSICEHTIPRNVVRALYDEFVVRADVKQAALVCAANDYWCLSDRADQVLGADLINRVHTFDEIPDPFCGFAFGTITDAEATDMAAEIDGRYGDVVKAFQNLNSIDVVPAGCSKGTGVCVVAEHFGIDLIAGMGDSFNDLPMLEAADVAYTFHASPASVRAAADVLVDSAAEAIVDFMAR